MSDSEDRAVSAARQPEDAAEASLRPRTLADFTGQKTSRENLAIFIQAARSRGEALDHVLLHGPPGLGKTTLAQIVARDEQTGIIHDYSRKSGVDYSVILTPINADWITDQQQLWNKVEATERRGDAQLAREITLAIPT